MFGNLDQFIRVDFNGLKQCQADQSWISHNQAQKSKNRSNTQRSVKQFVADDKKQLLKQYKRKHAATQNRNRISVNQNNFNNTFNQIEKPKKNLSKRKALSMFPKSQYQSNQIAREALTRNHQLLRAVLRTQDAESSFKNKTEFEDSIQRMKQGYRKIVKNYNIRRSGFSLDQKSPKMNKRSSHQIKKPIILRDGPINQQKLRLDTCIKWVKKHNLMGQQCYQKLSQTNIVINKVLPQKKRLSFYDNKKMFQKIQNQIKQLRRYTEN